MLAAVWFASFGTPEAAWAHNALISTSPADGATVDVPPANVVLTFNEPAIATGTKVIVTGPDGPVSDGAPKPVDNTVRQNLPTELPAGKYTVEWRVTSIDGHPINGELSFTVKTGTTTAESATPSTGPAPTATDSTATDSPPPTSASPPPEAADGGTGWLWWLGIIPVGLALLLGWRFSRR